MPSLQGTDGEEKPSASRATSNEVRRAEMERKKEEEEKAASDRAGRDEREKEERRLARDARLAEKEASEQRQQTARDADGSVPGSATARDKRTKNKKKNV